MEVGGEVGGVCEVGDRVRWIALTGVMMGNGVRVEWDLVNVWVMNGWDVGSGHQKIKNNFGADKTFEKEEAHQKSQNNCDADKADNEETRPKP